MKTINFTRFPLYGRNGKKETEKNLNMSDGKGFNFFDFIYKNSGRDVARKMMSLKDDQEVEMTGENIRFFLPYIEQVTPAVVGISFELFLKENGLWKDEYEQ